VTTPHYLVSPYLHTLVCTLPAVQTLDCSTTRLNTPHGRLCAPAFYTHTTKGLPRDTATRFCGFGAHPSIPYTLHHTARLRLPPVFPTFLVGGERPHGFITRGLLGWLALTPPCWCLTRRRWTVVIDCFLGVYSGLEFGRPAFPRHFPGWRFRLPTCVYGRTSILMDRTVAFVAEPLPGRSGRGIPHYTP